MNEDETPIVADVEDTPTENILEADGGVTTTPEEVAELLHLAKPVAETEVEETDEEKTAREEKEATDAEEAETARLADEKAAADLAASEKIAADEVEAARLLKENGGGDVPKVFELVIEDVNGEKFTINPDDDIEEALKDFEPKSNGQIYKILDDLNKLREEKKAFDAESVVKAQEAEQAAQLATINEGWDKEITALQGAKRLEVTTDGKPSARVTEVFDFMGKENDKRLEDGRPLLRSFEDALDKLELQETKEAAKQAEKEEKELARKRGGIVGGSSAPATGGAPVYKGGARSAGEASRMMGLRK